MNILLVARDPGPSRAFRKVAISGLEMGHNVHTVLGDGHDLTLETGYLYLAIDWADVLLVGMSSTDRFSALELGACWRAIKQGTRFGLFSDSFECWRRQHFAQVREHASYLFVSSDAEVSSAQVLYPNATVVASGNPMWEELTNIPYSREEARQALGVQGSVVVVCPGNKAEPTDPPNKNVQLVRAVYAGYKSYGVQIAFLPHPGDRANDEYYADHLAGFAEVVSRGDNEAKHQWVRACNAVVSACSPSTDLQALLLGTLVVNVLDDEVRARLRREFDADVAPLVAYGYIASADMSDPISIRCALESARLRMAQGAIALPEIAQGAAAKKIVDTMASL